MTDENQQNQSQSQTLVVNIQNSSDPALERRIFSEVASEGRQLGLEGEERVLELCAQGALGAVEPHAAEGADHVGHGRQDHVHAVAVPGGVASGRNGRPTNRA